MSLSELPLSYCTNVHPGQSVGEVEAGLDAYAVRIAKAYGHAMSAGLWLARPVVSELLSHPEGVTHFAAGLARRGLTCHTLNAFPYGNFHSQRVKENVYLPDWTQPERLHYSIDCARVLATLLPAGVDGSISTVPLGFLGFKHDAEFHARCAVHVVECAKALAKIAAETGRVIRLAVEPEPFCEVETTPQAIEFFELLWQTADRAGAGDVVREHIGLCYDICHQAVEYEVAGDAIGQLARAGVRINKVHISCALQLDDPRNNEAGRAALRAYVEPRYLHQTMARTPDGAMARVIDLTTDFLDTTPAEFLSADSWRVHFHVPVDAEGIGPLATTRPAIRGALAAVRALDYAPHLEVETYTWAVLPGVEKPDLVTGLSRELIATRQLLATAEAGDMIPRCT